MVILFSFIIAVFSKSVLFGRAFRSLYLFLAVILLFGTLSWSGLNSPNLIVIFAIYVRFSKRQI